MQRAPTPSSQAFVDEVRAFIADHWADHWADHRPADPAAHPRPPGVGAPVAGGARPGLPAARERAWLDALVARGWSVPDWPVEHGGTGWSAEQHYLWRRELALAEAPDLDEAGVAWAGPAIWTWGDAAQRARFLPPIREGRERWCLGIVDPEHGPEVAGPAVVARRGRDGYRIDGMRPMVAGADGARWMLTLARTGAVDADPESAFALFAVDLATPGVQVLPVALLGGLPGVCRVRLDDVAVPLAARIGAEGTGLAAIRALEARAAQRFEPAAALQVLARRLVDAAAELPGDDGPLLEDAGFARKLAELDVDLAGLEALEQRQVWQATSESGRAKNRDLEIAPTGAFVDPRRSDLQIAIGPALEPTGDRRSPAIGIGPAHERTADRGPPETAVGPSLLPSDAEADGAPADPLPLALKLRHRGISQRIGDLFVEAFGYYSLPYPDPLTIDNEGPIGHHYALAALRGMLAARALPADEEADLALRDRIANQLFRY